MNQREAVLQSSRSARPAFHSRGTSAMAQCRFILTVGYYAFDGPDPRSTFVIFRDNGDGRENGIRIESTYVR